MFERAPVYLARRGTTHHRSLAFGVQSASTLQLTRPPDAERVRRPTSDRMDRRKSRLLWLRTVSERGQRHVPECFPNRSVK